MTLEGYDRRPRVRPAAEELAKQGAQVVSVFGSPHLHKGQSSARNWTKVTNLPAA
jgi:hypothetical protein